MDFQDFYSNYLRHQQLKGACVDQNQDENEFDSFSANTISNYTTRPINTTNFNSNSNAMQDEATMKIGIVNGMNNNNNSQKGFIGYANNKLNHQQRQLEDNKQRVFGRELCNIDQDRTFNQNNIQNNNQKIFMTQKYMKQAKAKQNNILQSQNYNNNNSQQTEMCHEQNRNTTNQLKRNMSVEYLNNPNNTQSQNTVENNFYSQNNTSNQCMIDENQSKLSYKNQNNENKANTCKASFDKENFQQIKSGFSTMTQSVPTNQTSRSRNTMDVESTSSQYTQSYRPSERSSIMDYTFPKDKLQKDPIYQHARTIFDYLRNTEENFCAKGTMSSVQGEINVRMRAIMVDWLVDVHLKFKLLPETLYLSINLIDRYIERKQITKDRLQLLGATSMFIACKLEEIYPPEINDFVFICDNLYNKDQILEMEGDLITTINFDLTFTSPLRFLDRYCYLNQSTELQYFCAQYLLELALIEYSMTEYCPSKQAASALYLISTIFEQPWTEELRCQSQYDKQSLKKCAMEFWQLMQKSNEFQYKYARIAADAERQEKIQNSQLSQWYKNEKDKLLKKDQFVEEEHQQLEIDYATQKKQIEARIKEMRNQISCNNKNLVAIIRKFSLPKFMESAKFLFTEFFFPDTNQQKNCLQQNY